MTKVLLFQKDFTERGKDLYYLLSEEQVTEVSAEDLVKETDQLICHDFWLIAPSLYRKAKELPSNVVDLIEFSISISGIKSTRKLRERQDIQELFSNCDAQNADVKKYLDIFYRTRAYDEATFKTIGAILTARWTMLTEAAASKGEFERQMNIEIPVFNLLYQNIAPGICIDIEVLRGHKEHIEHDFYTALKHFAHKHNVPLEVPDDRAVIEYLEPKGFDFSGISVDYMLGFVLTENGFGEDLLALRKLDSARRLLSALPYSKNRVTPIIDIFGSITSRIYFKDPIFQNLLKTHRNIIIPEPNKHLAYVDFDQFEVGIMAALSGDLTLTSMYMASDLYSSLSELLFGTNDNRKFAKRLFLSYAYGMKMQRIADAVTAKGADRAKVKEFFRSLTTFEQWKVATQESFLSNGRIGTSEGNLLLRMQDGPLTAKEKRSCISQVVQGTASLIFKKALLELGKETGVRILIPMHDAVLVEHEKEFNPARLPEIFSLTMTNHFKGSIAGKASLESFASI